MSDLRERVLDATFAEVAENGLGGLTVEAVAGRAGSSRATIYRHFPGGRDELVLTTIRREIDRFFDGLGDEVGDEADLVRWVAALIVGARRLLGRHDVLQHLLVEEAEALLPSLATVHPLVQEAMAARLQDRFEASGVGGSAVDAADAADHCSRMVLSYVGAAGSWDLADATQLEQLVRTRILAGLAPGL